MLVGQPVEGDQRLVEVVPDDRHGVAQQQHEGGVDDVLAGEAGVEVEVGTGRAQGVDQGDDGVPTRLRVELDVRDREPLAHPGRFDDHHRLEEGPVGEQVSGARVAGPEQ